MLVDLEDPHVPLGDGLAGPCGDRDGNQPQDLLGLLPGVDRRPLVGAEHEYGCFRWFFAKEVDRVGMRVEPHFGVADAFEGQSRQLEPRCRVGDCRLVPRTLRHEDEQSIDTQFPERSLR